MSRSKRTKVTSQTTTTPGEKAKKLDPQAIECEIKGPDEDSPHFDEVEWDLARHEYAATMDDRLY
ncbi:MAG: hypothetical protein HY687_04240 [Chloroflexi bacterium]|nr:hypothetical protein [Chloroflexota bacterium]